MGIIHKLDDMVGTAHDNDETWCLFEQVDLTFGSEALALFGQKSIRGFRANAKQPADRTGFRLHDWVVGEREMRLFRRPVLVDPDLNVVHLDGLALEDLIKHRADRLPCLCPNLLAGQTESGRVLASKDRDEGIVVDPYPVLTPHDEHGLCGAQNEIDEYLQLCGP
jgi:hypothetical protein